MSANPGVSGPAADESTRRLGRALRRRPVAAVAPEPERLLKCLACDYGTQALVVETLIEMLVRKNIMTEDEFAELLDLIDARDGRLDGTLGAADFLGEGI